MKLLNSQEHTHLIVTDSNRVNLLSITTASDVGYHHDDDVVRYDRSAIACVVNWGKERDTILQIYDNKYIAELRLFIIEHVKACDEITHNRFIGRIIYTSELSDGEVRGPPFNPSGQNRIVTFDTANVN